MEIKKFEIKTLYNAAKKSFENNKIQESFSFLEKIFKIFDENQSMYNSYAIDVFKLAGEIHFSQCDFQRSIDFYRKIFEIAVDTNNIENQIACSTHIGLAFQKLGNFSQSLQHFNKVIEISEKNNILLGKVQGYGFITDLLVEMDKPSQALEYAQKYLNVSKKAGLIKDQCHAYFDLGRIMGLLGRYHESLEPLKKGLAIADQNNYAALQANEYNTLGKSYMYIGRHSEAFKCYDKAIRIINNVEDNPELIHLKYEIYSNIGNTYSSMNNYSEALKWYYKYLEFFEKQNNLFEICNANYIIGIAFKNLGKTSKALSHFKKAIKKIQQTRKIADPFLYKLQYALYGNLGMVYMTKENHHKALKYFHINLEYLKKIGDLINQCTIYLNIGAELAKLGKKSESIKNLITAMDIAEKCGDYETSLFACINLERLFQSIGQNSEARMYQEKAFNIKKKIEK
ncbi:MAG: tetratricopeptide repeat protein [Promethearchaeota archaeon]